MYNTKKKNSHTLSKAIVVSSGTEYHRNGDSSFNNILGNFSFYF